MIIDYDYLEAMTSYDYVTNSGADKAIPQWLTSTSDKQAQDKFGPQGFT
jgi:hypothetical protein